MQPQILAFFQETFWAMQYHDMHKLENIIDKMLHLLTSWEFLKSAKESSDFVSADDMKNEKYSATVIGTRIATKVLKDGDEVEVDAEKGIVKIIKKAG